MVQDFRDGQCLLVATEFLQEVILSNECVCEFGRSREVECLCAGVFVTVYQFLVLVVLQGLFLISNL